MSTMTTATAAATFLRSSACVYSTFASRGRVWRRLSLSPRRLFLGLCWVWVLGLGHGHLLRDPLDRLQ
jgi:hypothetical protein